MAGGNVRLPCNHDIWGLDERCCHASFDVELGVAMEEPDAGVVGNEADRDSHTGVDDNGVSSHGCGWGGIKTGPLRFVACATDNLEYVAVEMERVGPRIVIIQVDLDDLPVLNNLRVDLAIYLFVLLILRRCC